MRAPFAATALLLFGFTLLAPPASSPADLIKAPAKKGATTVEKGEKKISWLAFDAAVVKAKSENKHMIVDVYTTWCGWCKVMDRQTYSNADVAAYLNDNFVLAKVNGESSAELHYKGEVMTERAFARKVGVTGFPTTYFLKPDADIIGGAPGYIPPDNFMIYAKYVSTKWYEKGSPQDYLKATGQQGAATPAN
jgi:thioredoxin-related protein